MLALNCQKPCTLGFSCFTFRACPWLPSVTTLYCPHGSPLPARRSWRTDRVSKTQHGLLFKWTEVEMTPSVPACSRSYSWQTHHPSVSMGHSKGRGHGGGCVSNGLSMHGLEQGSLTTPGTETTLP